LNPRIAVIVPNRNDSRHLSRCIRSLLEQDDAPDELIVVDDQSTDERAAHPVAHLRTIPARLLQNPERLGTNGALNRGSMRRAANTCCSCRRTISCSCLFARAREGLARHPGRLWSALGWLVDEDDRVIRLHRSPVIALRDAYISPEECVAPIASATGRSA
jgi:glycosyltransferase involved in cell wall biosynthesis